MTYPQTPQFPQQQPQQGYPPQGQMPTPGYSYPPQAPGYPQQPQQGYPQPQPGYPQQYPQMPQQAPQQPAVPLPQGNLSDFYNQPSVSGGPSWTFKDKQVGTTYVGFVERAVTNADIEAQTIPGSNQLATDRKGNQKWVMKVPMLMQPDAEHPEGKATWYVTGQARDELVRAMFEANAPEGPPEPGAYIGVQLIARKPSKTPGWNPSNQVRVVYQRPEGAAPVPAPAHPDLVQPAPAQPAPAQPAPVAPVEYLAPVHVPAPPQAPVPQQMPVPQMVTPPAPQQPVAPVVQQMPQAPAQAAPQPLAMPAGVVLDDAQQALLAKLTGQQTPAA